MGFRNIKIDSHVKLSIKNQQLNIETDIARQIPLEDINCIIIENQTVTVSAYLLQKWQIWESRFMSVMRNIFRMQYCFPW